jgi:hypothetical protein
MSSDTWEVGPSFDIALADGALAVTSEYVYAIGGDANGGGPFDASAYVYVLAHADWPGGAWTDLGDPLPVGLTANNGGFCTTAVAGGEVWSTGGIDYLSGQAGNNYRPSGLMQVVSMCPGSGSSLAPSLMTAASGGRNPTAFPTMTVGGVYRLLSVKSDDPMIRIGVPVTMNVVEPVYGAEVSGTRLAAVNPAMGNLHRDGQHQQLLAILHRNATHAYTTTVSTGVVGPVPMGELLPSW